MAGMQPPPHFPYYPAAGPSPGGKPSTLAL